MEEIQCFYFIFENFYILLKKKKSSQEEEDPIINKLLIEVQYIMSLLPLANIVNLIIIIKIMPLASLSLGLLATAR